MAGPQAQVTENMHLLRKRSDVIPLLANCGGSIRAQTAPGPHPAPLCAADIVWCKHICAQLSARLADTAHSLPPCRCGKCGKCCQHRLLQCSALLCYTIG